MDDGVGCCDGRGDTCEDGERERGWWTGELGREVGVERGWEVAGWVFGEVGEAEHCG